MSLWSLLKRQRGLLLALIISSVGLAYRWSAQKERPSYHRLDLPGYDAYVYMAMANDPAFFTVPPWGYRVLTPWIVHDIPLRRPMAFRYVTSVSLVASAVLLFAFLRRLGNGETASLVAVAAFILSPPVRECIENYFLAEPLTMALTMAYLFAIESGSHPAVLGLWATLGTLSKESMVALLPLVYFARRDRIGDRRALVETFMVALPVAAAFLLLRAWWTPYIPASFPRLDADYVAALGRTIQRTWPRWIDAYLLNGLTVLALLGAIRRSARPFLRRYGYLPLVAMALPVFSPAMFRFALPHLAADLTRYSLYALAGILPLCLIALDRIYPHLNQPPPPASSGRASRTLATVSLLVALGIVSFRVDRYRRVDMSGRRDGRVHLALTRQSIRTATLVAKGEPLAWDLDGSWPDSWSGGLAARPERWFLLKGWELSRSRDDRELVHASGVSAELLLPVLELAPMIVGLSLSASEFVVTRVEVNGVTIGSLAIPPEPREQQLRISESVLFRGDNVLTLRFPDNHQADVRLHRYLFRRTSS